MPCRLGILKADYTENVKKWITETREDSMPWRQSADGGQIIIVWFNNWAAILERSRERAK